MPGPPPRKKNKAKDKLTREERLTAKAALKQQKTQKQVEKGEDRTAKRFNAMLSQCERDLARNAKNELTIDDILKANICSDKYADKSGVWEKCIWIEPHGYASGVYYEGSIYIYGGEFSRVMTSVVYGSLYKFDLTLKHWEKLEIPYRPPPRSAHQMCLWNKKIYIWGGELSTVAQYHHYDDLWSFDLETLKWTDLTKEVKGNGPSGRSGHRAVIYNDYMFIIGGFYDNGKEVKYYGDCYALSLKTLTWITLAFPERGLLSPRSGFLMFERKGVLHLVGGSIRDSLGNCGTREELISVDLNSIIAELEESLEKGLNSFEPSTCFGEHRMKNSSTVFVPSGRCMTFFQDKILLFGGAIDSHGISELKIPLFCKLLHILDLEDRTWTELTAQTCVTNSPQLKTGSTVQCPIHKNNHILYNLKVAEQAKIAIVLNDTKAKAILDAKIPATVEEPGKNTDVTVILPKESNTDLNSTQESIIECGPCGRSGALFVSTPDKLYMFGGFYELPRHKMKFLSDIWIFDGQHWSEIWPVKEIYEFDSEGVDSD